MKKVLLGSTALVAAGLIAGDAAAADGVKLSLGGYYRGVAGVMFDDFDGAAAGLEDDLRDYVFKQDVEVHFKGETTLDNGLTVGAVVQLEGQTSADQIDEVYAYFSGGWGELRFGDDDEALSQLCSITPSAAANFGPDSPFFSFSNSAAAGALAYAGTNGTCYGTDSDLTKLIYFSPNFGGFSFAMSFTPDGTQDTRNTVSGAGTRFENNAGQLSDNLSLAANFNHDFNGVTLNIGGGATWNFDREGAVSPTRPKSTRAMRRSASTASPSVAPWTCARTSVPILRIALFTARASPTIGTLGPSASAGPMAITKSLSLPPLL